ncbi:hypothetical protein QJS10_CPB11g01249 [Acorus calamus]|uniref:Uncharacterized protein n=1 Tax=Acorus calamus TaxID=4465 RepID=A0AAV9DW23_ACOCL|nr:hypothetical protein QJS10_CPB11g01249 [Acorus calamus]
MYMNKEEKRPFPKTQLDSKDISVITHQFHSDCSSINSKLRSITTNNGNPTTATTPPPPRRPNRHCHRRLPRHRPRHRRPPLLPRRGPRHQLRLQRSLRAESLASTLPRGAVTVRADVSIASEVKALFDRAEEAFGGRPAHVLVNCAGILDPKYPSVANTAEEDWDRTFAVNAKGAFLCCREAAARLVRGGGGRIVAVTTSVVGSRRPGYGAYAASKAAVETMVGVMAKELKGTGITVNFMAPGPIATDMFFDRKTEEVVGSVVAESPMGRLGEVGDVAPVVGFLTTDGGGWINGQVIRVNGGFV